VPMGPPDPILGLSADFRACTSANKVNLVVRRY
jgi:aspartate/tyrosine/aromatic aminotransferase